MKKNTKENDIYLAEPLINEQVKNILVHNKHLSVFVPKDHKIENGTEISNEEWGKKVFDMDIEAIKKSRCVVMLYYGLYSDSGTAWECGYAHALEIPIVTVLLNKSETSVMVINGSYAVVNGVEELRSYDFEKMPLIQSHTIQK